MFVPRQLDIKRKSIAQDESPQKKVRTDSEPAPKEPYLPSQQLKQPTANAPASSSPSSVQRPTVNTNDSKIYDEEVIHGLGLILSDYAYAHEESARWLQARERRLGGDGENRYIHLSAFLEHKVFGKTKPPLTQTALQRALQSKGSELLELSPDGYHVRRRLRPTPLAEDHETDWDAQTIYVEPHLSSLAANAPRLVRHLLHHSTNLPEELRPIQAVQSRHPSWAFVTFSGSIDQVAGDVWPEDWIVLTNKEHARRDEEYRNLIPLHRSDPRAVERTGVDTIGPGDGRIEGVRDVLKGEERNDNLAVEAKGRMDK